jgi:hypothetical protein
MPNVHIISEAGDARGKGVIHQGTSEVPVAVHGNDVFDIQNEMLANEDILDSIMERVEEGRLYREANPAIKLSDIGDPIRRSNVLLYDMHVDPAEKGISLRERAWQIRDGDTMRLIRQDAHDKGFFSQAGNFILYVYVDTTGEYRGIVKREVETAGDTKSQGTVAGPLGGVGYKVEGSSYRYRLTPEGALMMLNGLNNQTIMSDLNLATVTNTTQGRFKSLSEQLDRMPFQHQRQSEAILAKASGTWVPRVSRSKLIDGRCTSLYV